MRMTRRVEARSVVATVVLAAAIGLLLDRATRPSPPMELREIAPLRTTLPRRVGAPVPDPGPPPGHGTAPGRGLPPFHGR